MTKQNAYHYIDLQYLELMSSGDVETKKTLLEMLIEELETILPTMRHLFEQKKYKELQGISHTMKSTLAFTGNKEMIRANEMIWNHLDNRNYLESLQQQFEVLESLRPNVIKELKEEQAAI